MSICHLVGLNDYSAIQNGMRVNHYSVIKIGCLLFVCYLK